MTRGLLIITLCFLSNFGESENLPKNEKRISVEWYENCMELEKIDRGQLNILSFNTWALPVELAGHDHKRRFSIMADSLMTLNRDILCLQETFHPILRHNLMSTLTKKYYTYSDYHCNSDIIPYIKKDCYGGLMTLSVYPILSETFYKFPTDDESSIIEKIGSKGFLVSVIRYGAKHVNIINTHLYAGDSEFAEGMRKKQIIYMFDIIQKLPEYQNATILAGDFNVNHPDVACSPVYDYITDQMLFFDTKQHLSNVDFTSDNRFNRYVPGDERPTKLDYIFYKAPPEYGINIVAQSRYLDSAFPLSDHFGWGVDMNIVSSKVSQILISK